MPKLYMLIGVPASGKSTWLKMMKLNAVIASTDDYIESFAEAEGKTYDEVFASSIKKATAFMYNKVAYAVKDSASIIWDQTNLTRASRVKKLKLIPDSYEKIAIVFPTPEVAEWKRRLESRPNKTIPNHVLQGMMKSIELPSIEEGFDEIIIR